MRAGPGRLLWPAGRARDSTPGSADWRKGRPRWPGTRLSLIVVAVLVGLFIGIFTGPAGAVGGACYLFCTHMFWGGGPVALASRR